MEKGLHKFEELFSQLGLASDEAAIAQFIATHSPLSGETKLADATFWNKAQASFLREEVLEDADWAELVDNLDAALRAAK